MSFEISLVYILKSAYKEDLGKKRSYCSRQNKFREVPVEVFAAIGELLVPSSVSPRNSRSYSVLGVKPVTVTLLSVPGTLTCPGGSLELGSLYKREKLWKELGGAIQVTRRLSRETSVTVRSPRGTSEVGEGPGMVWILSAVGASGAEARQR